jgi:hypothetical protein
LPLTIWRCTRQGAMVERHTQQEAMRKFRVFVKDKFNAIFDTIEKARECRRALKELNYKNIVIRVTEEDLP